MIEIVQEGTLEKHGINMFGEMMLPLGPLPHCIINPRGFTEARDRVLAALCGPMGRVIS